MKRFFTRKNGNGVGERRKSSVLTCPHCDFSQEVLFSGISTFCKNCHQVINLEKVFSLSPLPVSERPVLKRVICFHCDNEQSIPSKALSSFCKKCGKRINLQNYRITGKFSGALETQGTLHVTSTGELRSNVICHSAIIEGKISGTIRALGKVELRETAIIKGSIQAIHLIIKEGAAFRGAARIRPEKDTVSG